MTAKQRPLITLLTDFGLEDEYVGVMKGVILGLCREAQLIDISHAIPPQQIRQAADMLATVFPYFPRETVHLAVVDPGVGTSRRILIARLAGQIIIAPDNGLLTPFLEDPQLNIYMLHKTVKAASTTFHGRDIMAPLAAQVAGGTPITACATPIAPASCIRLSPPLKQNEDGCLIGEVTYIDHFGNLFTSLKREDLLSFATTGIHITICSHHIAGINSTYGEQPPGSLLALINSRNQLEIACNQGNAAHLTGAEQGTLLRVERD